MPEPSHPLLSLALPPGAPYQELLRLFIQGLNLDWSAEHQTGMEAALQEVGTLLCPPENSKYLHLDLSLDGQTLTWSIRDVRELENTGEGDPHLMLGSEGDWESARRSFFSKVEYRKRQDVWELILTKTLAKAENTGPLPLAKHKVLAGAGLAG